MRNNYEGKLWHELVELLHQRDESVASGKRALDGLIDMGDCRGQTVGVEQEIQLKVSRRFLNAANNKIELVEEINASLIADNQKLQGDLDRAHDRIVDSTRKLDLCVTTEYHDRLMASAKVGRDSLAGKLKKAQAANTKLIAKGQQNAMELLRAQEKFNDKLIECSDRELRLKASRKLLNAANDKIDLLDEKVKAQSEHLDARQGIIDQHLEDALELRQSVTYWTHEFDAQAQLATKYQRLAERLNGPTTYPAPGEDKVEIEDLTARPSIWKPGSVFKHDPRKAPARTLMERMDRIEVMLGVNG
jgi:hypothetical protein